jgi:hypothetical protein
MSDQPTCLGDPPVPGCNCGVEIPRLVRCPDCGGQARIADAPCPRCESGYLPACLNCQSEPRDALFAPCCSGACRDEWEAKERRARSELGLPPIVRRAPLTTRTENEGRPLCRTSSCADFGILADDRYGWCQNCHDARAEDAAEEIRELRRLGAWD